MTQPRLCQIAWKWQIDMLDLLQGPWGRLLNNPSSKMIKNDPTVVVSLCEKMEKWYATNDLEGLCKRFGTPTLKNDLFWHNRGCVKFHQNDEIALGPARSSLLELKYDSTSQIGVQLVSQKSNTKHKIVDHPIYGFWLTYTEPTWTKVVLEGGQTMLITTPTSNVSIASMWRNRGCVTREQPERFLLY